jgi:hypothetical protein
MGTATVSASPSADLGSPVAITSGASIYAQGYIAGMERTGKAYIYPTGQVSARLSGNLPGRCQLSSTATIVARGSLEIPGLARGEYALDVYSFVFAAAHEVIGSAAIVQDQSLLLANGSVEASGRASPTATAATGARGSAVEAGAVAIVTSAAEMFAGADVVDARCAITASASVVARGHVAIRSSAQLSSGASIVARSFGQGVWGVAALTPTATIKAQAHEAVSAKAAITTAHTGRFWGSSIEATRAVIVLGGVGGDAFDDGFDDGFGGEPAGFVLIANLTRDTIGVAAALVSTSSVMAAAHVEASAVASPQGTATVTTTGREIVRGAAAITATAAELAVGGAVESARAVLTASAIVVANGMTDMPSKATLVGQATVVANLTTCTSGAATQTATAAVSASAHAGISAVAGPTGSAIIATRGCEVLPGVVAIVCSAAELSVGSEVECSPVRITASAAVAANGACESSGKASPTAAASIGAAIHAELHTGASIPAAAFVLAAGSVIVIGKAGAIGLAKVSADGNVGITEWVWYGWIRQVNPALYPDTAQYFLEVNMSASAGEGEARLVYAPVPATWSSTPGAGDGNDGWLGNAITCTSSPLRWLRSGALNLPAGDCQYRVGLRKNQGQALIDHADLVVRVS